MYSEKQSLKHHRLDITRFISLEVQKAETWLAATIFLSLWIWLSLHAGGPRYWDELLYMETALNPSPLPHILNRYFHIYLIYPFIQIMGDPFIGVKVFWSFLVALTTLLVYLNSRLLTGKFLPAIVAVLFFASQGQVFLFSGEAWADFTVMMLITLAVTVYLLLPRLVRIRQPLMAALGLLFYFAFRSKETGIVIGILFLGLGMLADTGFNWGDFLKHLRYVMAGILIGMVVMAILDQLILGDALFALRPSHWKELLSFNLGEYERVDENWYQNIAGSSEILGPFLLYLIGWQSIDEKGYWRTDRVVWLLALALLIFLSISMISGKWGVIGRYFTPGLPVICILASRRFHLSEYELDQGRIKPFPFVLIAISGILLSTYFATNSDKVAAYFTWEEKAFTNSVLYPITLTCLIGVMLMFREWKPGILIIALMCLSVMLSPAIKDYWSQLGSKIQDEQSRRRFSPLAASAQYFTCSDQVRIFVSSNYHDTTGRLSRNVQSSKWMFNLFFDCDLEESQFIYSDTFSSHLGENFDYAYLLKNEWDKLAQQTKKQLKVNYNAVSDNRLIFLYKNAAVNPP